MRQISAGVPTSLKLAAAATVAFVAYRIVASSTTATVDDTSNPGEDPVSPELALIDTDLRERLVSVPDPPEADRSAAVAELEPGPVDHHGVAAPGPLRRRRGTYVGSAVAATLAACGVVAAAGFGVFSSTASEKTTGATPATATATTTAPAPTVVVPPPSARSPGAREFAWAPTARAIRYDVEILRGGALVYAASTTVPRLHVPNRWKHAGRAVTLSPGTYTWYVWPIVGTGASRARGPAIVATTFTIAGP